MSEEVSTLQAAIVEQQLSQIKILQALEFKLVKNSRNSY
jgi:hypothetical protein